MESVSKSQYFRKFYLGTIDESNSYDKVLSMVKENVKKLISTYGKCATINIIKSQLEEFFVYDENYTTQKMVNEISDEITREEEFKRYNLEAQMFTVFKFKTLFTAFSSILMYCLVSSVYPAWRASRISILKALQGA